MTVKVRMANGSSDSVDFLNDAGTTLAQVKSYDSGSSNGQVGIFTTANGVSSEKVRVDSAGNVGIGTSSPSYRLDVQAVNGIGGITSTTGTNTVNWRLTNTGGTLYTGIDSSTGGNFTGTAYAGVLWHSGAYPLVFATSNAEKMRINSNGDFLLGTTNNVNGVGASISTASRASSSTLSIQAANATSCDARIYMECPGVNSGGFTYQRSTGRLYAYAQTENSGPYVVPNGTSWTTNSDERLKTDIAEIPYGLDTVLALSPKQYKYKTGDKTSLGLIAQQTALVIPEIVDVPEDPELMMGIEYTGLIPVLVKAIQEQQALINNLTERLAALEAK